jgi:WD40 repeat protein
MTGHKSTVSCLAVASGILYSGSWDGTIRSWWLTDHTPLSVLEDDVPGNIAPVLSISTEASFVVSSYENGYLKVNLNLDHE